MASRAPSGANKQPWSIAFIKDQDLRKKIRTLSEREEKQFYENPKQIRWQDDLKHLHTDATKDFLTEASHLLVIFGRNFETNDWGTSPNYYVKESVGIMTGFLLSALHLSGLHTLTYTPSKMKFLNEVLDRPRNERPFLVIAAGLAHPEAKVPVIEKKPLEQVMTIY